MTFWIILSVIVAISIAIAAFVYFTGSQYNHRRHYYGDNYDGLGVFIFYPIVGVVVGGILGAFFGFMAATSQTDEGWVVYEEQELVALATQQEREGSAGFFIFLGYGYEGETRKAYWTERDDEGVVTMDSKDAEYLRVREVDTQPRVLREHIVTPAGAHLPWEVSYSYRETLEVPIGTLITEYEFQP